MADILPKLKLFLYLSILQLIINLGISMASGSFDIVGWAGMIGGAFIPFVSMISLVFSGFPVEVNAIFLAIIGIISGLQTYMVGTTIWSLIPFVDA
jgi:hypothetical protein